MISEKIEYLSKFYDRNTLLYYSKKDPVIFDKFYNDMQPKEYNILDLHDASDKWYVDSPDGLVPVVGLISKGTYRIVRTEFNDGTYVNSSGLHCFENLHNGWIAPINLTPGYKLKTLGGFKTVASVVDLGVDDLVFDLVVGSDNHRYYTNGVSSHNSGAGKSLFLQNLAVNWAEAGFNVVYLSLELSEKLCSMRIDAMHTGYETRDVMRNIDDVHMKVRASQMKSKGSLRVKQLPNGCTSNDIRAFIKEYEIFMGIKVDCILVDYLDLMMPMSKKISAENLFVKDKYVTEELRNLAVELQTVTVSASQLNRGSYEEIEFDPSHIAGGISKVNTADNVIGIFTSAAMKESGRYQIQFMKTRSSSGVGSKVDLEFNTKSLRITDLEEDADDAVQATSKNIYEQLKKKSVVRSGEKLDSSSGEITKITPREGSKVDAIEGAAGLRAFLKKR
jgi:DnaB-like helicase C terminal domain